MQLEAERYQFIVHFRADGVRFARQFLGDKIQLLADERLAGERLTHMAEVAVQPHELLMDVRVAHQRIETRRLRVIGAVVRFSPRITGECCPRILRVLRQRGKRVCADAEDFPIREDLGLIDRSLGRDALAPSPSPPPRSRKPVRNAGSAASAPAWKM